MALTTNLVAYYKFDGNSNDSVGTNNGTDTSISYVPAKINDGASFNGSSSRISLAVASTLTTNFTIAGWTNSTTLAAYRTIYSSGTGTNFWRIGIDNTGKVILSEDNIADYTSTTALTANTFQHVAIVKSTDSGTNVTFYLNGSTNGTATVGSVATPSGTASFGSQGSSPANFWSGILDEFGIWDRALSGSEITQLYNSGAGLSYPFSTTVNSGFFMAAMR